MARFGQPGQVIDGRYRLESLLGAGGFGEVWHASQEVEGSKVRPVALKLLTAPATGSSRGSGGDGTRWLNEVRAVRDVRCASIATIFDVGIAREPRVAFIAMELLQGRTLEKRIEEGGPIYWRRALAIGRDIARALAACHAVDVAHCDLKPQNVLLDETGRVFVLDFGVAALGAAPRNLPAREAGAEIGVTGAVAVDEVPTGAPDLATRVFGTPGYIAPENFRRDLPGPASDVYSLGVVLYQMIAGRLPYRLPHGVELPSTSGDRAVHERWQAAIARATVQGDLDALDAAPPAVRALVHRLLATDPAARPTGDLVAAIDEAYARPYGVPDPPYVGLAPLDPKRAGFIAGRDEDARRITEKLGDHRAIVLVGPSGCGKSSLAFAAVAARLDEQLAGGLDGWKAIVVRPSATLELPPVEEALGQVVIVDQLEEILRLSDEDRRLFGAKLLALVEGSDRRKVIATVRDDLFGRVAALPELGRFPEQNLYTVRGVEPNAIAALVEGPAKAAGFSLEDAPEVVSSAARLLAGDPTALPLVQFALTRWWEARDATKKVLPKSAWGGIEGALADAAQAMHDAFTFDERTEMRELLVALFRPDGTRVRVDEKELRASKAVLARLLERRLVTQRDGAIEVVHEALARRWPLLRGWLDETRADRQLVAEALEDAGRWRRAGKPDDMLWRGSRLAAATAVNRDFGEAREFVDAAVSAARRSRRSRQWLLGVGAAIVVGTAFLISTIVVTNRARQRAVDAAAANLQLRNEADEQRGKAETAEAAEAAARKTAEDRAAEALQAEGEAVVARAKSDAQARLAERQQRLAEETRRFVQIVTDELAKDKAQLEDEVKKNEALKLQLVRQLNEP